MDFFEELEANNIDPDKFIALHAEFVTYCRNQLASSKESNNYRAFLERDQMLTKLEKMFNTYERKRLMRKINAMTNPTSSSR